MYRLLECRRRPWWRPRHSLWHSLWHSLPMRRGILSKPAHRDIWSSMWHSKRSRLRHISICACLRVGSPKRTPPRHGTNYYTTVSRHSSDSTVVLTTGYCLLALPSHSRNDELTTRRFTYLLIQSGFPEQPPVIAERAQIQLLVQMLGIRMTACSTLFTADRL